MGTIAATLAALLLAVVIGFALLFIRLGEVESRLGDAYGFAQTAAASGEDLHARVDELQIAVDELTEQLSLTDGDGATSVPPELAETLRDIADDVNETRDLVQALDDRVDQICDGVPVC